MIVNQHFEGWQIILHYTHGLFAGKIADELATKDQQSYWLDVVAAIVQHDDLLATDKEVTYLTKAGAPMDFTLRERPQKEAFLHAQRIYTHALQKSQLMALLIGRHLEFLNTEIAKTDKKLQELLSQIKNDRQAQRKLYTITKEKEDELYAILLFCDRLSLILLQQKVPDANRKLEINQTISGHTYYIQQVEGEKDTYNVEPWCFTKDFVDLNYEHRILKQLQFDSSQELLDCVIKTVPELATVRLQKAVK